jgi:leader peptidase (prepilin peptidase)/N-methyltransferase
VWQFGFGWKGFGAIVFSCFLVALSGIDLRTQLLPDQLTLPLMWLGLVASIDPLYLTAKQALVGAIIGSIWLAAKGRDRATPIPFGPYLAIAGWIVFFWGGSMVDWYLRIAGLHH